MTDIDAASIAEMALRMHDEPDVPATVEVVLEYALKAVGCDYAGVIFVHAKSRVETIAATDPLVANLDAFQMSVGHGPDIDALEGNLGYIVSDTRTDQRWPEWAAAAADLGIRSLLNVRLYTSTSTIGTLNLYSTSAGQFTPDDQEVAHVIARHAAVAISNTRTEVNLATAIDSRKRIGLAQGILMERYGLDPDRAFAILVRYSQDRNIKLRDVAERLIDSRELP